MQVNHKEFVVMMASLMAIVAISIDALIPALEEMRGIFAASSENHVQLIINIIFAGMAIGQLIAGPASDAVGRKKVLYVSILIYLVGSMVCLCSNSLKLMLFGRFIQGLGVAGPSICAMSIIRDCYGGVEMAKVMSLVVTIFITIPVIAPALGQMIITIASWEYIFGLYVIYSIALFIWIWRRLSETLPLSKRIPLNYKNLKKDIIIILKNKQTRLCTMCMGCIFGAFIGDLVSAQQVFQKLYGIGDMFVVYFALQAMSFGGASYINSRLVDKYGMLNICKKSMLAMVITSTGFLILYFAIEISFWMFFLYGFIMLFFLGLLFGNLNSLALEPMGKIAGLASSVINAASNAIAIPLGTIIGQSYNSTIFPLLLGFALLCVAAMLLFNSAKNHIVE